MAGRENQVWMLWVCAGPMIYFNSDYLEGAHPYVMEKLNETNMVQTVGYGEDGRIQATLDLLGVPYTGSGYLGSGMAMDLSLIHI